MLRQLGVIAVLLSSTTPTLAKHANDYTVRAAGDAFGTSLGHHPTGAHSATDVRDCNSTPARDIRVQELSTTEHGGFDQPVPSGSASRAGLTAQSYPFWLRPALPTAP